MVAAAHGFGKRAASPLTTRQFAASVSVRTLALTVGADYVLVLGWSLLHKRNDFISTSAGTRRNVTCVAIRTTVEMVAAAHGIGKGAASIPTTRQLTASVSVRARAAVGTDYVLVLGWSLLHKWNDFILTKAGTRRNVTCVAIRTTVEMVAAAHGIGKGAASIPTTRQLTASVSVRARAAVGTDYVLVLGWSLLHKWNDFILTKAGTRRNVTCVAIRTTVEMVAAAHGIGKGAASIPTTRQLTASVSVRARAAVGTDYVLVLGWSLLHKWNDFISLSAGTRRNVTCVAIRTTVEMVAAAHGFGKRAASPLTTRQFAASVSIRTLTLTVGADYVLVLGWSLLHKRNDFISLSAGTRRNVTCVAIRTTVEMVAAAHGFGKRAASPLTTRQFAASVSIRTLTLTVGADYVLVLGWSLLHKRNDFISLSAGTRRNVTCVAIRTTVEMVAAAHGFGKRAASILTTRQFAASVSIRTLALTVGADYVLVLGWSLLHKRNDFISLSAGTRRNVTCVAIRTTVEMVAAAHGFGKGAASILTTRQFAASVSVRTLALTVGADYVLELLRVLQN